MLGGRNTFSRSPASLGLVSQAEKTRSPKMKWITREHVKVDRVACPWLIKKFVDPYAEFYFVPSQHVLSETENVTMVSAAFTGSPLPMAHTTSNTWKDPMMEKKTESCRVVRSSGMVT